MPTTLRELSETASRNLREVISDTLMPDDAREQSVVVRQLTNLVRHLQTALESAGERPRRANPGPATHLATAQSALRRAAGRLPALDDEVAALHHGTPLARAVQAAAAVQDLIASHRGRDGIPVTPYALAFTERPARSYLVHCSADLAWGAARVAHALGEAVTNEGTAVQLYVARGSLDQASVFGRTAGGQMNRATEAFPHVPPLDPRPALPTDAPESITAHLADDCERLSRVAFEALHGRGESGLSGSDVQQLTRWRAMSDLLSGRILLHVATSVDPHTAEPLREAAGRLRETAQAWQESAAQWHRVVDLSDPRVHPKLPLPSYHLARSGQFTHLPKTPPHPALLTAHSHTTRLGQLLYGMAWNPETPGRPVQRDTREVLADAGGLAELTHTMYRVAACRGHALRRQADRIHSGDRQRGSPSSGGRASLLPAAQPPDETPRRALRARREGRAGSRRQHPAHGCPYGHGHRARPAGRGRPQTDPVRSAVAARRRGGGTAVGAHAPRGLDCPPQCCGGAQPVDNRHPFPEHEAHDVRSCHRPPVRRRHRAPPRSQQIAPGKVRCFTAPKTFLTVRHPAGQPPSSPANPQEESDHSDVEEVAAPGDRPAG
ncbi:hypothetical protein [Streptomyces pactum]|uniref:Uncharacterized protein n=1 Tax=Streptomyces pactum TaxID=68249 RepID=A0A1S6J545_9ACTN|nr:hypothetical protein [Streptomyces pactum]AQS66874.1 hypothetical protein B1H29_08025 [Streptomyces pactum]